MQFFDVINTQSLIFYTIFSVFHYYQVRHAKYFMGSSEKFLMFLSIFAGVGTIFDYSALIFIGYKSVWYVPIIMWISSIVLSSPVYVIETKIPNLQFLLSILGFIAVPVFGFLMLLPYLQ